MPAAVGARHDARKVEMLQENEDWEEVKVIAMP
jgi:hypothetical protein